MKKTRKPLALNRETLRSLSAPDLVGVAGGMLCSIRNTSCSSATHFTDCCPTGHQPNTQYPCDLTVGSCACPVGSAAGC